MICPYCKEEIADGSIKCKHCQSMINPAVARGVPIWTSITSLVLGILASLCMLDEVFSDTALDSDAAAGLILFGILGIVFSAISLSKKHRGKGMAIAGLVLGIIGFIWGLDSLP